jgi:hypothetical protein
MDLIEIGKIVSRVCNLNNQLPALVKVVEVVSGGVWNGHLEVALMSALIRLDSLLIVRYLRACLTRGIFLLSTTPPSAS